MKDEDKNSGKPENSGQPGKGNDKKLNLSVLIENDGMFQDEFNSNQKLQVIVNKAMEKLGITADGRELKREDGTPLLDLSKTIAEIGLQDGEVLRFFKKVTKPDRDKGFALVFEGWHSRKELQNLYQSEIGVLSRGLGGDFIQTLLIEPENAGGRLIVIGDLKYEGGVQGIQIVFPVHYPYMLPKILPLHPMQPGVAQRQAQHFNKGNQYSDGAMCLLRSDQWNKIEHNIGWCIRRSQEWLKYAHSTEGFPKDKVVLENPAHLPHIGQILFPREYTPAEVKNGEITLSQFKPNHYIFETNVLPDSGYRIPLTKETFKWVRLENGTLMKDLALRITANPIEFVINTFGENIMEGAPIKNVGIYLPDDPVHWHFFKLQMIKSGQNSANFVIHYFITRTVEKELFLRTKEIFDDQILASKKVTIVGLGALGSEVAKSLGKNGVGTFKLFDHDVFELGNSVRHAADLYFIGEDKVDVVKQLLLRSNPNVLVEAYKSNVLDDQGKLTKAMTESDLCIILTAEDSVDYFINSQFSQSIKAPLIFARVSSGGLTGAIQVVESDAACLNCLRLREADVLPIPKGGKVYEELAPEYGSCSAPAFPGSEIDTKEVALQTARVAMQLLLKGTGTKYPKVAGRQFYWHGPFGSKGIKAFTWEVKNIEKHKECATCNGGKI